MYVAIFVDIVTLRENDDIDRRDSTTALGSRRRISQVAAPYSGARGEIYSVV